MRPDPFQPVDIRGFSGPFEAWPVQGPDRDVKGGKKFFFLNNRGLGWAGHGRLTVVGSISGRPYPRRSCIIPMEFLS